MQGKALVDWADSVEHPKFETTRVHGLKRKAEKKCKKNIKNS